MEIKVPSREHFTRLRRMVLILRQQIEERDAHHVKGLAVQIHDFVQGPIRESGLQAIRQGLIDYVNEDSYSAAGWPNNKRVSHALVSASAVGLVIDDMLSRGDWSALIKEADRIAVILASQLDLRLSESVAPAQSPTINIPDATATAKELIPHRVAVSIFRLTGKTAKEESKFMATIRKQFGIGCKDGRIWEYELRGLLTIAAAMKDCGRKDGFDPTPAQIAAAAIEFRRKKGHLPAMGNGDDSPRHPPIASENS